MSDHTPRPKRCKTPDDYRNIASARGYTWQGPQVYYTKDKTWWKCKRGHEWEARYDNIQHGKGCPYCAVNGPKLKKDYQLLAENKGYIFVGPAPSRTTEKTKWQCSLGHIWSATWASVSHSGCPDCARAKQRIKPEQYHHIAEANGIKWLGPEVKASNLKTAWECRCGNIWETSYVVIKMGSACPKCAIETITQKSRKSAEDYHDLARLRGISWLGPEVDTVAKYTFWKCQEGHLWKSKYSNIQSGTGCPTCADKRNSEKRSLPPEKYYEMADEKVIKWLGPEVPNTTTKTWWQCPQGHEWETTYNRLKQGSGCPHCVFYINGVKASKIQIKLQQMVGGTLNYKEGNRSIDIALTVNGQNIAIEYDCYYWHRDKTDKDLRRARSLIDLGWKVLSVKSDYRIPSKRIFYRALQRLMQGKNYVEIIMPDWGKD